MTSTWKKIALNSVPDPQQHMYAVGSIVAGIAAAGATTVLSGGFVVALGLLYTYRRGERSAKFDEAIKQHEIIAPALRPEDLKAYITEIGIDRVLTEIKWAEENDYPISGAAIELLESTELPVEIAESEDGAIPSPITQQIHSSFTSVVRPVQLPQPHTAMPLSPKPSSPAQSLVERIVEKPEHLLGIGASESGKGILFSNMAVAVKQKRDCILIVIDPKGDPNEVKFFDGVADRVHRFRASKLTPDQIIAEVKQGWEMVEEEFDRWAGIKPVYVFVDEVVLLGIHFSQKRDNFLNDKITAIVTMGKSLQQFVWIATQYPGIEELGIKGGIAAQMSKILIARDEHQEMLEGWRGYKLTRDINFAAAIAPMRKSPVKRAVWFKGEWSSMQIMPILSGFCRETGKHVGTPLAYERDPADTLPNLVTTTGTSTMTVEIAEVPPRCRGAAEVGNSAVIGDIQTPPSRLGDELAESVIEYFRCAVLPQPKKLTDIKGASRFKGSPVKDEELLQALANLVARGQLAVPMVGFWALPSWDTPN
jgi:hypothetical protein